MKKFLLIAILGFAIICPRTSIAASSYYWGSPVASASYAWGSPVVGYDEFGALLASDLADLEADDDDDSY